MKKLVKTFYKEKKTKNKLNESLFIKQYINLTKIEISLISFDVVAWEGTKITRPL